MRKQFDILFLVEDGIGNAIEMLYAVEYCILNGKKTGVFLNKTSASFVSYLRESYGEDVILEEIDGVKTRNLVHSWLYTGEITASFESYFLVAPTYQNTIYLSETEQYLSIVRRLYPSEISNAELTLLKEDYSARLRQAQVEQKYVVYPGSKPDGAIRKWPYYEKLIDGLGTDNILVLGGGDDLENDTSYYYPRWLTRCLPRILLRRIEIARFARRLGLLTPHSHLEGMEKQSYSFFNVFSWAELVALLRRAKAFVGNDGGLAQLAGACGAPGVVIFGPTSVNKNRPYNHKLRPVSNSFDCQPCQFGMNGKDFMRAGTILCPFQLRCLYSIDVATIIDAVGEFLEDRDRESQLEPMLTQKC